MTAERRGITNNAFVMAEHKEKFRQLGCPEASMMELHATSFRSHQDAKDAGNFFGETTSYLVMIQSVRTTYTVHVSVMMMFYCFIDTATPTCNN